MKNKHILIAIGSIVLCCGVFVSTQLFVPNMTKKTQQLTSTSSQHAITSSSDYEAIANAIKSKKEPIIVGQVFKDGYLQKHGNHYHYVKGKPPKDAIYEHNKQQINNDSYVFNVKDIVEENEWGYVVKHNDHYHFVYKKHNQSLIQTNVSMSSKLNTPNSPMSKLEKRIAEIMALYGLKRHQIIVNEKENTIVYLHGDHYHYEKIDFTKPLTNNYHGIEEEKDDRLAHTEEHKVVGPLILTRKQLLNKKEISKAYPNLNIKNMDHYHIVGFLAYPNSNEKVGLLKQGDTVTEAVAYLVLKNTPWNEVTQTIKVPEIQPNEGYYFKSWTYDLPTEGVVDYSRVFGAQFRLEKYKNSPFVLGPSPTQDIPGSETIDRHDYISIAFHSLPNGSLILNGMPTQHVFYLVKQGTTWKQAFANGLKFPETKPNQLFEFTGFATDILDKEYSDEQVSLQYVWAKFGTTLSVAGVYTPSDITKPLDKNDIKRPHPRDPNLPYDDSKYVSVALIAGENGKFETFFEQANALTYIVRRDVMWKECYSELPRIVANIGYRIKNANSIPNNNKTIEKDAIITIEFEKIEMNTIENSINNKNVNVVDTTKTVVNTMEVVEQTERSQDDIVANSNQIGKNISEIESDNQNVAESNDIIKIEEINKDSIEKN